MLLNVINPWDVRASLLKEAGRATGEVGLVITYICIHMCFCLAHVGGAKYFFTGHACYTTIQDDLGMLALSLIHI